MEGKEKAGYYSVSDLFILPTNFDCWGLVVNEAVYYGLPVISTDKAAAVEIINNKTGIVIPNKNPNILASAINKLLDNKMLGKMKQNTKKIQKQNICDINTPTKCFNKAIKATLSLK